MHTISTDIECYHDFFYIGFKRKSDGKRVGIEYSRRNPIYDRDFVRRILLRNETVGYNSLGYDLPMIWYSLGENVTPAMLKRASDDIILGPMRKDGTRGAKLKPWEVEDHLGIRIPWDVKRLHIDLMEPQPNAFASLKVLNGRMHGKRLMDLPFHPDTRLTDEQMDVVADYCLNNDLDATEDLFDTLAEPLELRRALSARYDQHFMSKSDAQIGEAIVKKRVEEISGRKIEKVGFKPGTVFRYPVPDFIKFETPQMQSILERIRNTDFVIKDNGKVDLPQWLVGKKKKKDDTTEALEENDPALFEGGSEIRIGKSVYKMGIGGLHSTEKGRAVHSTSTRVLVDADVASQYPSIILLLGLYPQALGPAFLEAYEAIKVERLQAKARAKAIERELPGVNDPDRIAALKKELLECKVGDKGGKIQLNGVYGKLGSRYSALYAPHLLISVTLTGQLTLLMLIEKAELAGIPVASANTDGVLFDCPREMYAGLNKDRLNPSKLEEICSWWEKTTSFELEFGEYASVYNDSVNSYYAIKPDGGHKRKGPIGNPWNLHKSDFDPVRGQLMKNPQMTICSDAALAMIKHGTPVEDTIRACRDIRQFVTVINSKNGATWRDGYLGKVVRYYWGYGGEPILSAVANDTGTFGKVPGTDGAIEIMDFGDEFPSDIDYEKYIERAEKILSNVGFYGDWKPPMKRIRLTKANRTKVLTTWMCAP